ncbi:MAG TPA: DeoR/GlpR family DNA-binding transcription regulator [Ruminiclostridium sp.]
MGDNRLEIKSKEPLYAEERKLKILDLIKENDKVSVIQLRDFFNVSGATIRNDLRELESSNLLKRTHGGAMLKNKTGFELDSQHKEGYLQAEKESIAEMALDLVEDGDTIILDTGTTTLELAKKLSEKRNLTVVINDIQIARYLEEIEDINIIFIGGAIRKKFHCTVGTLGTKMISELAVDKAFMATNGISVKRGATTPEISQAETKKAMIAIANKVIVLCDSSKIGRSSFAQFAEIQQVDIIITDRGIEDNLRKGFESQGIEVMVAQ